MQLNRILTKILRCRIRGIGIGKRLDVFVVFSTMVSCERMSSKILFWIVIQGSRAAHTLFRRICGVGRDTRY